MDFHCPFKPQITLRTTFAVVTVICMACAIAVRWVQPIRAQSAGRSVVSRLGGTCRVAPASRSWAAQVLPTRWFEEVVAVDFSVRETTQLSDEDLALIAQMDSLEEIDLTGCRASGQGMHALARLGRLRSFTMRDAPIDDEAVAIASSWRNLEKFDISIDIYRILLYKHPRHPLPMVSGCGLTVLAGLPQLRDLRLAACPIGDADMAIIARMSDLERLELFGTQLGDAGAASLGGLRKLRTLSVSQTAIADAGLSSIAKIISLERLACSETRITDRGVMALIHLPSLRSLDVSYTHVTDTALHALASMASLTELNLQGTPAGKITDAGAAELCRSPSLQALYLDRSRMTAAGWRSLARLQTLKKLAFEGGNPHRDQYAEFAKDRPDVEIMRQRGQLFEFD